MASTCELAHDIWSGSHLEALCRQHDAYHAGWSWSLRSRGTRGVVEYGSPCQWQLDTHTHFLSLSGVCARAAHSCLLCFPPILLVTKPPSLWEARGISRDVAVSSVWQQCDSSEFVLLEGKTPWAEKSWEGAAWGSAQAVSGHVPAGCRDGGNMQKAQKKSKPPPADVGTVTNGPSFGRCSLFEEVGRGRCWQWLRPVLEAAGKVQFSHWGGNSQAWCSFTWTISMCWMKWFLSYSGKLHSAFRDSRLHTNGECFTFAFSRAVGSMVQHTCPNSWVPGYRPNLFIQPWAWWQWLSLEIFPLPLV